MDLPRGETRAELVFNHLVLEPSVRARLVCLPQRGAGGGGGGGRGANYVHGSLNKQCSSTSTLLAKLDLA